MIKKNNLIKSTIAVAAGLCLIALAVASMSSDSYDANDVLPPENKKPAACIGSVCYEIEIADDSRERERGLMFREELAGGKGMLFVFDREGKYPFWMKNTKIALDIVWFGADGKIVFISKNTPPCAADYCPSYAPDAPAKYVLEVAAGQMEAIGAAVGDTVKVEF